LGDAYDLAMRITSLYRWLFDGLFAFASGVTRSATDSDQVQLRKSTSVLTAIMVAPAAIIWGVIYLLADEPVAAAVPLSYTPLVILNIAVFKLIKRYQIFEFIQRSTNLLLPLLLMIALGGFVSSSAVVIWTLVTPMGAIVNSTLRMALFWFGMFLGVVVFGALIDGALDHANNVPEWARLTLFAGNILGPSSIAFFLLVYFVKQNDTAYELVEYERGRSEALLDNVLPSKIAERLKDGVESVADRFDEISVLFADMVGSTVLASRLSPEEMVGLLNEIFTEFDEITLRHGVEKISTSGDNYVVAAGVPEVRVDHAVVLVRVALEMRDFLGVHRETLPEGCRDLSMRFGINTGPAVAGVVGQRNFHYDIWGDAVNTASRMESTGEPGRIQVSEATYRLVRDDFDCEERGEVEVKGKGVMRTWWVGG
jgi:adenylate cyclase